MGALHQTREAWLLAAVELLRGHFKSHGGYVVPRNVKVSCSWPSKTAKKTIGQVFAPQQSASKNFEVFISPVLGTGLLAIDTLVHELVHVVVGFECKHGGAFKVCATAVGLEGKMACAGMSPKLEVELTALCKQLGPYPHATVVLGEAAGDSKQTTRMIKLVCEDADCGYTVRTTRKWIDVGLPTCYCGCSMEVAE